MTDLVLPEGITKIEGSAFATCASLTSITIPASVTSIGDHAFYGCTNLTEISVPNHTSIQFIGDSAFTYSALEYNEIDNAYYCGDDNVPHTVLMNPLNRKIQSFDIKDGTKIIMSSAFSGCFNLKSVVIPGSVSYIGEGAFSRCGILTSIQFEGTIEEWRRISKNGDNLEYTWTEWENDRPVEKTCRYIITCTDGTISKDGTVTMNP